MILLCQKCIGDVLFLLFQPKPTHICNISNLLDEQRSMLTISHHFPIKGTVNFLLEWDIVHSWTLFTTHISDLKPYQHYDNCLLLKWNLIT
jgi:hypothetical protein